MPLASKSMRTTSCCGDVGLVERHHLVALADVEPRSLSNVPMVEGEPRRRATSSRLVTPGLICARSLSDECVAVRARRWPCRRSASPTDSDGGEAQRQTSQACALHGRCPRRVARSWRMTRQLAHGAGTAQPAAEPLLVASACSAVSGAGVPARDAAHRLYAALVEQARQPVFYADWGVPDSRDGRLELVQPARRSCSCAGSATKARRGRSWRRALFDLMFEDLDRHLREWGVGDLSVGKQVKKLAQSFLGRAAALDPLLAGGDRDGARGRPAPQRLHRGRGTAAGGGRVGWRDYLLGQDALARGAGRRRAPRRARSRFAPRGRRLIQRRCRPGAFVDRSRPRP